MEVITSSLETHILCTHTHCLEMYAIMFYFNETYANTDVRNGGPVGAILLFEEKSQTNALKKLGRLEIV